MMQEEAPLLLKLKMPRIEPYSGDGGFMGDEEPSHPFTREVLEAPVPLELKMPRIEPYSGDGGFMGDEEPSHPFTREVLEAPVPINFKMPKIEAYSGQGDPIKHLQLFRSWMELQGVSQAFMCRAFPLMLSGAARKWFTSCLKPGSIGSFTQLCQSFISHFVMGIPLDDYDDQTIESPFTRDVLEVPLPTNFEMPQIKAYSGERQGDPIKHLQLFRSWMELQGESQAFMCRAFPLMLSGAARKWFTSCLKPGSIGSFTQLCQSFISHFVMGIPLDDYDDQTIESPFTRDVLEVPLPTNFEMPQIKAYSGERQGDPAEHLDRFRYWMVLYAVPGAIRCRAFSLTLEGAAQKWFWKLIPGSIGSFTQLSKLFIDQFMSPLYEKKPIACLFSVRQRKEEPLKDFMVRFNNEAVAYNDDEVMIRAMISGLQANHGIVYQILNRELLSDIAKDPPKSYTDLIDKACRFSDSFDQMINGIIARKHAEKGTLNRSRNKRRRTRSPTNTHEGRRFHR